jgi:hypothetical protein
MIGLGLQRESTARRIMYKQPLSTLGRLLPALLWLVACALALRMSLSFYLPLHSEGHWRDVTHAWPAMLGLLGFVVVAICTAYMACKEYQAALPASRADTALRRGLSSHGQPQPLARTRYPLPTALQAELQELLQTLQNAGMLLSGEVAPGEVLDCAETCDEWSEVDLYMAMHVLHALHDERQRFFTNIAFIVADPDDPDAVTNIVQEFARVCGRSHEISAVRVRSTGAGKIAPAPGGSFPSPNAVAEFELGTEQHAVPFVLYRKDLPGGLLEALAKILITADDPRRFVWACFDSFFSVCYLTPTQTSTVNSAERAEFPRFEAVP